MVDTKTVEYIAELARLGLSEDEKKNLGTNLAQILSYVEQLNEVSTSPTQRSPERQSPSAAPMRSDEVVPSLEPRELLNNGPCVKRGFFAIPKVIQ